MMKYIQTALFISISLILASCANETKSDTTYGKATTELIEMVEGNPEIKRLLIASIEKVKEINPDKVTNPAQSLEEYYEFVSWAETSMPWQLINPEGGENLTSDILQGVGYFYYLVDQPLPELEGNGNYRNTLQYVEPFSSWLVDFSKNWGAYLSTEDSWNETYYQTALAAESFGVSKGWYEDPSNWKTFNQFFSRYLKDPDQRPIASKDDSSIVVSAADAVPQGIWSIDSSSYIAGKEGVKIKLSVYNSIEKLIGEDSKYNKEFANGKFIHSFLSVNDYHRYHFPLSGTIKEVKVIPGKVAIGAVITWDPVLKEYTPDVSHIGWQSVETRGCVIVDTEEFGLVAMMPIGMATVSSVNFEENIKVGVEVSKGDPMGYFLFGGSDFIMIFQEKAGFTLDAPQGETEGTYAHRLMGEPIGRFQKD